MLKVSLNKRQLAGKARRERRNIRRIARDGDAVVDPTHLHVRLADQVLERLTLVLLHDVLHRGDTNILREDLKLGLEALERR